MLAAADERICLEARRHGAVLARPLSRALVLAGLGAGLLMLFWVAQIAGAVFLSIAALIAVRAVWRWERTRLVVTTEKMFVVYGTLRRRAAAVRLARVEALELEQSLFGRMLGYGTIVAGPLEVSHVPNAKKVYRLVEHLCE